MRPAWLLVTLIGLYAVALTTPELWRNLITVCAASPCELGQPSPEGLAALSRLGLPPLFYSSVTFGANYLIFTVIVLVMGFLLWKKPQDRTVALLAFAGVTCSLIGPIELAAEQQSWLGLAHRAFAFIAGAGFALGLLGFPDGRYLPPWGRWIAYALALAAALVFVPGLEGLSEELTLAAFLLTFPSALVLLSLRFRRANEGQRQQIKWVLYSIGVMVAATAVNGLFYGPLPDAWVAAGAPGDLFTTLVGNGSIAFFWLSIALSVYRYRLFDIDLIIRRTLVYGGLTAGVTLLYAAFIATAGVLALGSDHLLVSLLATGAVALAFGPLHERLQRGVNRLLYGYRDEPYHVLTELGRRLEATFEPASVLPATVQAVAQALKVPFVEIALEQEGGLRSSASFGERGGPVETFSLVYTGEALGELRVSPRSSEDRLGRADADLLTDLARQVGVAAHALLLQADLERSRLRVVTAREEARRGLGNDLHDTVGHQFTALTRRAETAGNLLAHQPEEARRLLAEIVAQGRTAAEHVRALAHQLHPPELEVLGLTGIIREWAETEGGGLLVQLELPDDLPRLPAAVEVAAYCTVREALGNVSKHARARRCRVRLALVRSRPLATSVLTVLEAPVLEIDITDDGCGLGSPEVPGLGLTSMRERAAEVGGTCCIEALPGRGTRVAVRLPCPEVL